MNKTLYWLVFLSIVSFIIGIFWSIWIGSSFGTKLLFSGIAGFCIFGWVLRESLTLDRKKKSKSS